MADVRCYRCGREYPADGGSLDVRCPACGSDSWTTSDLKRYARCREDYVKVSDEMGGVWTFCDRCPRQRQEVGR